MLWFMSVASHVAYNKYSSYLVKTQVFCQNKKAYLATLRYKSTFIYYILYTYLLHGKSITHYEKIYSNENVLWARKGQNLVYPSPNISIFQPRSNIDKHKKECWLFGSSLKQDNSTFKVKCESNAVTLGGAQLAIMQWKLEVTCPETNYVHFLLPKAT